MNKSAIVLQISGTKNNEPVNDSIEFTKTIEPSTGFIFSSSWTDNNSYYLSFLPKCIKTLFIIM